MDYSNHLHAAALAPLKIFRYIFLMPQSPSPLDNTTGSSYLYSLHAVRDCSYKNKSISCFRKSPQTTDLSTCSVSSKYGCCPEEIVWLYYRATKSTEGGCQRGWMALQNMGLQYPQSDFNTGDGCLFPVSNQQSVLGVFCNHDHSHSSTVFKSLLF